MTSTATAPAATASTTSGIHPLLADRWSTRAFDAAAQLEPAVVERLLEAARWSPSAANTQPWRLAVAPRGTDEHAALLAALAPGNARWAHAASALLVVAATTTAEDGQVLPWAVFDAGQALGHLTVQAAAEGVAVHTMGGFDAGAVRDLYALPEGTDPVVVVALGRLGAVEELPEDLRARETAPRTRRPLGDLLLAPAEDAEDESAA